MRSASSDAGIVLAARDHVVLVDDSLHVASILQGDFSPMALSLDELGNIYLVVGERTESGENVLAVWGLTPDGERFLRQELTDMRGALVAPPLIGYDRDVTILFEEEAVSVGPLGGVRWKLRMGGPIAGGTVTADSRVLISAGTRVLSVSPEGERFPVIDTQGDFLQTPPVPISATRLYVASASALYIAGPMQ